MNALVGVSETTDENLISRDGVFTGVSQVETEEMGAVRGAIQTVTPPYRGRPDAEMTAFGLAYFLVLFVLLVPLLPFVLVYWVLSKAVDAIGRIRSDD